MTTYTDILETARKLDDQQRLYLIDALADMMADDDVASPIFRALRNAFEVAEVGTNGVFAPHYPAAATRRAAWADYTARRDDYMARAMGSERKAA